MRVRRSIVVLGLAAIAITGVVAWQVTRTASRASVPRRTRSAKLDLGAFRALTETRVDRARAIAARPRSTPSGKTAAAMMGRGPMRDLGKQLLTPCILGPAELCTILTDLVTACDDGDARACLTVGQFLSDTPPRPTIASIFFFQACRIGDRDGCDRADQLRSDEDVPCADDPLACGTRAQRTNDEALLDEACSLGVADACSWLSHQLDLAGDEVQGRVYFEAACQLGFSLACRELAVRLTPSCVPAEASRCYAPDPGQAAIARQIGCAAGWCE